MEGDLLSPIPVEKMYHNTVPNDMDNIPDLSHNINKKTQDFVTPLRTVEGSATIMSNTWDVATPVGPGKLRSSIADRIPFTSPRNYPHHNVPRSNVESIKRAKLPLDANIGVNHTPGSQPGKSGKATNGSFSGDVRAEKFSGVHAQDTNSNGSPRQKKSLETLAKSLEKSLAKSPVSNAVFSTAAASPASPIASSVPRALATDSPVLAGSPSEPASNVSKRHASPSLSQPPQKIARQSSLESFSNSKVQSSVVEDSDSDNDDHIDAGDDVTMIPRRLPPLDAENLTQVSKIIRLDAENDYTTPERFTEPVARSPETSQRGRVADTNESTTPLKNHAFQEGGVVEPTINLLLSPNSKPIFSRDYINKLQTNHHHELEELEQESNNQKEQILRLSEELSSTNREFLRYDQQIHELKLRNKKLSQNEEMLLVQLQHYERELLSTTKALKRQQDMTTKAELELLSVLQCLSDERNHLASLEHEKSLALERVLELETEMAQVRAETEKLVSKQEQSHQLRTALEQEISELRHELEAKDEKISELSQAVTDKNMELEKLIASKDSLRDESEMYKKENDQLKSNIAQLTKENAEIQQINSEQQEHLERVEKIAHAQMEKLELLLGAKEQEIKELTNTKEQLENEYKQQLQEMDSAVVRANESLATVSKNLAASEEHKVSIQRELEEQINEFERVNSDLKAQNNQLVATNKEKDEIIGGDTKKMNELTQKIKQLKEKIAELEKDNDEAHQQELQQLREHMEQQLELNRQRTTKKIDEVAELLYTQYSKKHETKVGMMRTSFNKKLDQLQGENNQQKLDIESLRKQLDAAVAEKDLLLELLDDSGRRRLSPKITRR